MAQTPVAGARPGPAVLPVAGSVLADAVRGVFTLTEATLVTDHWGPGRYAAVNGVFGQPVRAADVIGVRVAAGEDQGHSSRTVPAASRPSP